MTSKINLIHSQIESWFREGLKVVEPCAAVRRVLTWDGATLGVQDQGIAVTPDARLIVVAIGKAASAMARGAVDVLGNRIDHGIVLTKDGHLDGDIEGFEQFEASHPVPDQRGLDATRQIIGAVKGLSRDDVVLALISGGGSALLELPREPVDLEDMQRATSQVMHAGAGIHELNAVRSVLSQVKGGGLRRFIGDGRCVSLLLSDVLGNDPNVIASGPTIRGTPSARKALEIIQRLNLMESMPASIRQVLSHPDENMVPAGDGRDVWNVIADNETLVTEVCRLVERDGFTGRTQWQAYDGDAAALGALFVNAAQEADAEVDVLLGGGEATVEVAGNGSGGRNTEAALAAAIALRDAGGWVISSLASDGDDGSANAAGAIADPRTLERGAELGMVALDSLADNDSATYFRRAGGLVETGPSGTNVNDVYIAVRLDSVDS